MMQLRRAWVIGVLACVTPASADDAPKPRTTRADLGEGFTLAVEGHNDVVVIKNNRRARLERGDGFEKVSIDKPRGQVIVDIADDHACSERHRSTWTYGHLEARIENWAAYELARKRDYRGAIAGFQKATERDPSWNLAAYNLASAHQLAGDRAAAVKALAPWLRTQPVATYLQVAFDPDLVPLLERPELTALHGKPAPAPIKLTEEGSRAPLIHRERNLVAVTLVDLRWTVRAGVEIVVFDVATGARVGSVVVATAQELAQFGESGKGLSKLGKTTVPARLARLEAAFTKLGFEVAKLEPAEEPTHDDDKTKIVFSKAKLGVVITPTTASAFRGNTRLGSIPIQGSFVRLELVEGGRMALLTTHLHSAEGCDGGNEYGVFALPIRP